MSLELEYGFLYPQEVKASLGKIFNAQLRGALLKTVHTLHRACEKEFKNLSQLYQALVKEYAEHEENGSPKIGHDGMLVIKEGKKDEWQAKCDKLMSQKFEIKGGSKINVNQLYNTGIQLSSVDVKNLEPVLTGLDFEL